MTREEIEAYPAYVAFGVDKILRMQELDKLMKNIHELHSDIHYCYRLARNHKEWIDKLKQHNASNRAMVANNRDKIDEFNQLNAEWREFWIEWRKKDER